MVMDGSQPKICGETTPRLSIETGSISQRVSIKPVTERVAASCSVLVNGTKTDDGGGDYNLFKTFI